MVKTQDYFSYTILQITCLIIAFAGVISIIINTIIGLDYIINIITFSFTIVALLIWWFQKKYNILKLARAFVSLWILTLINVLWYFNFASEGPILSFFIVFAILIMFVWPVRSAFYITLIMLFNFAVLYYIDLNYNESLLSFMSVSDRIHDTYFGLLVLIIIASVFSYYAKSRYLNKYIEAQKANELKTIFLQNMSHELRTPLNAILGFSHLINKEMDIEEIVEYAETINKSGYQLLSVVNDLMDITLIEAGQLKIIKENVDFNELLNDIHEIISTELKLTNKDIRCELNIPHDIKHLMISTDGARLKQIILNLLKNAIKFTDKGNINYGYKIETSSGKQELRIFVEDSGIGIPGPMQNTIFETFRQVEESITKRHGGTGVGLSISKKLTELLGGKIWLTSEEGTGSTFYVSLPMGEKPV